MNMRNLKYFSFGIISLIFASCIEEKNLSIQNEEELYGAQNETYIEGWEKKTSNLLIYKRMRKV